VDDHTKATRRNFDQATAAGETAVRDSQLRYTAAMENISDLNAKLVAMMRANAEAALDATTQLGSAKTPADLARVWSSHATKQFAMLTDQAGELAAVWQRFFVAPR